MLPASGALGHLTLGKTFFLPGSKRRELTILGSLRLTLLYVSGLQTLRCMSVTWVRTYSGRLLGPASGVSASARLKDEHLHRFPGGGAAGATTTLGGPRL